MVEKLKKAIWPVFFLWVAAGALIGVTYKVAATPGYRPAVENKVQTVYNSGLQPQAQGAPTSAANPQPQEGDIFKQKGCIQCHSVSFYNVKGGATGPDLSIAYNDAPARFGKSLEKFLAQPEGTMGDLLPKLTNEEDRKQILDLLTKAAGKDAQTGAPAQDNTAKENSVQGNSQNTSKK